MVSFARAADAALLALVRDPSSRMSSIRMTRHWVSGRVASAGCVLPLDWGERKGRRGRSASEGAGTSFTSPRISEGLAVLILVQKQGEAVVECPNMAEPSCLLYLGDGLIMIARPAAVALAVLLERGHVVARCLMRLRRKSGPESAMSRRLLHSGMKVVDFAQRGIRRVSRHDALI